MFGQRLLTLSKASAKPSSTLLYSVSTHHLKWLRCLSLASAVSPADMPTQIGMLKSKDMRLGQAAATRLRSAAETKLGLGDLRYLQAEADVHA